MTRLLEIGFVLFAVVFLITQVIIPSLFNKTLFPIFQREKKLKDRIIELNQETVEQQLEKVIAGQEKDLAVGQLDVNEQELVDHINDSTIEVPTTKQGE